jgi:hypothetical protein
MAVVELKKLSELLSARLILKEFFGDLIIVAGGSID